MASGDRGGTGHGGMGTDDMDPDRWQQAFEAIWEDREEHQYPRIFGSGRGDSILALTPAAFAPFGVTDCDPRWLHHGIFEFPPTPARPSWAYVSSGLSNPWDDETFRRDGDSGLGMEFVIETPRQAAWAIEALSRVVAFQLLTAAGHYGDRPLVDAWDRFPPRAPLDGSRDSAIDAFFVVPAQGLPARVALASGGFDLLHIIGITADEHAYAKREGSQALLARLREAGIGVITDPARRSVAPDAG